MNVKAWSWLRANSLSFRLRQIAVEEEEVTMELSMKDLRELIETQTTTIPPSSASILGKKVLIRTVTFYYTGLVVAESDRWIVLEDAAWIPDTGRFSTALDSGKVNQVEPYPDGAMWVSNAAVVDISEWKHDLPRIVK